MRRVVKHMYLFVFAISLGILANSCSDVDARFARTGPKNIIVFISDGCGYYHVDAASMYQYGRTGTQPYEKFPVVCAMSTYGLGGSYDAQAAWSDFDYVNDGATDSAAAATAISCGVKTYHGAIGVGLDKKPLKHIVERCEELSKATGVITSVPLSHATPAGFVAHNVSRYNYKQIAKEMILQSAVDVIMGCGHPLFDSDGKAVDNPTTFKYVGGKETFDLLLAGEAGGDADGDGINDAWTLVQSRAQFRMLSSGQTPKRICGLPQVSVTLQEGRSGDVKADAYAVALIETVPTLEEMTKAALNVLDNDPDGFFLMVEGGAVDGASHNNEPGRLIEEQIDFNKSVEAVLEWAEENSAWGQTLVIVTADHECGYVTGPGSGQKEDGPVWNPPKNNGQNNQPGFEWHSKGHTNSLIPFYAKGCCAAEFEKYQNNRDPVRGPYIDNTDIAKVIFELLK